MLREASTDEVSRLLEYQNENHQRNKYISVHFNWSLSECLCVFCSRQLWHAEKQQGCGDLRMGKSSGNQTQSYPCGAG